MRPRQPPCASRSSQGLCRDRRTWRRQGGLSGELQPIAAFPNIRRLPAALQQGVREEVGARDPLHRIDGHHAADEVSAAVDIVEAFF